MNNPFLGLRPTHEALLHDPDWIRLSKANIPPAPFYAIYRYTYPYGVAVKVLNSDTLELNFSELLTDGQRGPHPWQATNEHFLWVPKNHQGPTLRDLYARNG